MLDIFIAVALALLSLASNYMGVHLTLRPQGEADNWKWKYRAGFLVIGLLSVLVIGTQAYRGYSAGEQLKATLVGQGQEIKAISDRPIQVTVSRTAAAQPKPRAEDVSLAHRAELKMKGTQLSAEILSFLSERNRSGLGVFRIGDIMNTPGGMEEHSKAIDAETKRYEDFRAETVARYKMSFDTRAEALLREMLAGGIDVQRAWYRPVDPEGIERFALDLAAVAAGIR
jgi:hypothetical protein